MTRRRSTAAVAGLLLLHTTAARPTRTCKTEQRERERKERTKLYRPLRGAGGGEVSPAGSADARGARAFLASVRRCLSGTRAIQRYVNIAIAVRGAFGSVE